MKEKSQSNLVPALDFSRFGINEKSGFLIVRKFRTLFNRLPQSFYEWECFAINLPDFYENHLIKTEVGKLPRMEVEKLIGTGPIQYYGLKDDYLRRAFQILAFTASAYIHPYGMPDRRESGNFLPDNLAAPFLTLAAHFGRKPIMSYQEYSLDNCLTFAVPNADLGVGNLLTVQNFVNSKNEEGFIVPHQGMECKAAPILTKAGLAQLSVLEEDNVKLRSLLWTFSSAIRNILGQQTMMWETCDWTRYAIEVRPQIQYFENVQYGTEGPVFEMLRGETGAQSALFKVMDALLGICHEKNDLTDQLDEMDEYMPREHRGFIEAVKSGPSVRKCILKFKYSDRELADAYNDNIEGLVRLRENHFGFMKYIPRTGSGQLGTGGTPIYRFLPNLIEETKACLID